MAIENGTLKKHKELHLMEWILPFFYLLSQYEIGIFKFRFFMLLLLAAFVVMRRSGRISFIAGYKPYIFFLGYVVLRDVIRIVLGADLVQIQLNRIIEYVGSFFLIFVICSQTMNENKLYKVWKVAGVIYAIGVFYQVVQIYILGQTVTPISIIPGYELRDEEKIAKLRPSGFFSEPAAFAIGMIPLVFLSLKRKDIKWAVFSTISIFSSTATVGIIFSIVLWIAYFWGNNSSFKEKTTTAILVVLIGGMLMFFGVFDNALVKFTQIISGGGTFISRVEVGFEVISEQSWLTWLVGTNYSDAYTFVTDNLRKFSSVYVLSAWRHNRVFLNTFSQLIFQYGIIGVFLYLYPLILYLKNKRYEAKPMVINALLAMFGQSMLLNSYYFSLVMLFILYDNNSKNIDRGEQK